MTPELKKHIRTTRRKQFFDAELITWHILAFLAAGLFYLVFFPFILGAI
jgi:hypothetical protein